VICVLFHCSKIIDTEIHENCMNWI